MLSKGQVRQAIQLYLRRSFTQCAVLIDGGWGVGKTYLLEQYILPEMQDIHYFHISLYGLSTISDIENEIYKCVSLNADVSDPVFNDREYFGADMLKGAKLGGISFAVQFLVKKYHDANMDTSNKLVLCFDDLERWAGDLNVCLSYINKIVEQEQIKCILLGNLDALDEDGLQNLMQAREKTIRHIYKFENPAHSIFTIALTLVDFQSDESREYVESIIDNNMDSLVDLLNKVGERNIRTVGEALQLYEYIYINNQQVFQRSQRLSFTYFVTLLSTLILLKKHFVHKKERTELVNGNYRDNKGFTLLKKLGYFDEDSPDYITEDSRILLDIIFYRLDEISLKGVFSIIENGFYIENDFADSFSNWTEDKFYEQYLDKYYFYQLEEAQALTIIQQIVDMIFDDKTITNPATLLLLAERLLNDIRKHVIDLDFEQIRVNFIALVRDLYATYRMDVVDLEYLHCQADRYPNSKDIFIETINLNSEYLKAAKLRRNKSFWYQLEKAPGDINRLLDEFEYQDLLKETVDSVSVIDALEALNNSQLYLFSQKLNEKVRASDAQQQAQGYSRVADLIADEIHLRYEKQYGIRASNMQEVAAVFRFINE